MHLNFVAYSNCIHLYKQRNTLFEAASLEECIKKGNDGPLLPTYIPSLPPTLTGPDYLFKGTIALAEHHLYGSSMLGIKSYPDSFLYSNFDATQQPAVYSHAMSAERPWFKYNNDILMDFPYTGYHPLPSYSVSRYLGWKNYELTDHLGNVNVSVLDKISGTGNGVTGQYAYLSANISSLTDYFPFGMPMPNRSMSMLKYRFGFNGMEKDDEVKGACNSLDFGARMYDSRLARFNSLDPLGSIYPSESNYIYVGNNPIVFIDVKGKFKLVYDANDLKRKGVSQLGITRYNNIVQNLDKVLRDNPEIIKLIEDYTGLNIDEIRKDFQRNAGLPVRITDESGMGATGKTDEIVIHPDMIDYLGNVSAANKEELSFLVMAHAITILHEYIHYGDKKTNGGKVSGQYVSYIPPGSNLYKRNYNKLPNEVQFGAQKNAPTSITGHRGTDIEVMGFGLFIDLTPDGKTFTIGVDRKEVQQKIFAGFRKSLAPLVPTEVPKNFKAENVLNAFNVN